MPCNITVNRITAAYLCPLTVCDWRERDHMTISVNQTRVMIFPIQQLKVPERGSMRTNFLVHSISELFLSFCFTFSFTPSQNTLYQKYTTHKIQFATLFSHQQPKVKEPPPQKKHPFYTICRRMRNTVIKLI